MPSQAAAKAVDGLALLFITSFIIREDVCAIRSVALDPLYCAVSMRFFG